MTVKSTTLWLSGLAVITAAVFYLGLEEIGASLRRINPATLSFLLLLQLFTLMVPAVQWRFLLKKLDQDLSPGLVFAVTLAGSYIESVTPAVKLGGEAAKVVLFHRFSSLGYEQLAGMLLVLKYFSLLPFVGLAAVFAGFALISYELPPVTLVSFAFLLLIFSIFAVLYYRAGGVPAGSPAPPGRENGVLRSSGDRARFSPLGFPARLGEKLAAGKRFVDRASGFARSLTTRPESVGITALSTLVWLLYPVKLFLVAHMLGLELTLLSAAVITYTAYLISMVPLLPGGLGSYEVTVALMFSLSGFSPADGLTVALLSRLVTYWFPLALSAIATAGLTLSGPLLSSGCGGKEAGFNSGGSSR